MGNNYTLLTGLPHRNKTLPCDKIAKYSGNSSPVLNTQQQRSPGLGVYFTDDFEVAKEISQKFGKEGAVFECNVNLGILKNLGLESGSTWQYEGFDSATAMHPPWFGLNTGWFREYCLKDRTKCSLRSVT